MTNKVFNCIKCGGNVSTFEPPLMLDTEPPKWFHECDECNKSYILLEQYSKES